MWKNIRAAAVVMVLGVGATGMAGGGWGGVKIDTGGTKVDVNPGGDVSVRVPGAGVETESRRAPRAGEGTGGSGEREVSDGRITLSGTGQTQTVICDDEASEVWIEGTSNTYVIEGVCKSISVSGTDNKVRVDTVGRVAVEGTSNVVLWRQGLAGSQKPKVSSSGVNNKVTRAR